MRLKKISPYLILICLLPFALLWRWIFRGEVLYWGTLIFQFWPWRSLVKTALLNGEWPLWNPLLGNGTPLLANLQSAVFYPPNWLYFLLPVEHGLTLSTVLHLALAGVGAYWYGRRLTLRPFAATVSGVAFMLSGYIVGRVQFVSMLGAVAWVFIAASLHEVFLNHKKPQTIIWLGIVLAMPLLAGHAQLWFYTLWLVGLYVLFRSNNVSGEGGTLRQAQDASARNIEKTGSDPQKQNRPLIQKLQKLIVGLWQRGRHFAIAVIIAILIAAVQLLPTLEFVNHSSRAGGAERTFALTYSFWPWRLITLLTPNFFGHPAQSNYWGYANYWEDHAYLGILPLLLSLIALWHYGYSKFTTRNFRLTPYEQVIPFFAALIPVSLILAMGWNTPIYLWVFDNVPGFGYFQGPARLLIWYTAALAVLAGIGAQLLLEGPLYRPLWRRLLAVGVAITVAAGAGRWLAAGRMLTAVAAMLELGVWLSVACTVLLLRPDPTCFRRHQLWRAAIIGLTALNLAWYAAPLLPTLPATLFRQPGQTARFLQTQPGRFRFFIEQELAQSLKFNRFFRFDSFGPNDTDYWQWLHEWLIPNMGVFARLPAANNDDPLTVAGWRQYLDLVDRAAPAQKTKLLQAMNVGYRLDRLDSDGGPIIYQADELIIRRIPNAQPEAYFVTEAEFLQSTEQAAARLLAPDFDSSRKVIIMKAQAAAVGNSSPPATNFDAQTAAVTVQRPATGRVELTVDAPAAGYVVLADTFYPGWQATVDRQPVEIRPANLAFRAVAVTAGTHKIIFEYKPLSFTVGGWISLLTLVALGGYLLQSKMGRSSL